MDATRDLILSALQVACREPREEAADERHWIDSTRSDVSVWAARAAQKLYTSPRVGYPVQRTINSHINQQRDWSPYRQIDVAGSPALLKPNIGTAT
jgi:hypothetical protein